MKIYKGIAGAPGIVSGKILYYEKKNVNSAEKRGIDEAVAAASARIDKLM